MSINSRLVKLEARTPQAATDPEELKRRTAQIARLYSDPQWAAAVKANAARWPSADNKRLFRIVELLEIAEVREALT